MRDRLPAALASLSGLLLLLFYWQVPIGEDGLFWWVPKALLVAETGPSFVLDVLPQAARPNATLPPQWAGGLPDYGHPPGWYWYLGSFLTLPIKTHHALRLAVLSLIVLFGIGSAKLLARIGGQRAAWGAMVLPWVPPIAAQFLRADTDLPLLALTPWALVAILDRRDGLFALTAGLATFCKEPGILLAAPALAACILDKRRGWGWAVPPLVLAAWAALHYSQTGWALAGSERLPDSLMGWLSDLGAVLWITLGSQGRWLFVLPAAWMIYRHGRHRHRALAVLGVHIAVQLLFFGTVNFLGGIERIDSHTHVRYLIPAILGACAIVIAARVELALVLLPVNLLYLHQASPYGPEASLYGADVQRAVAKAAPEISALGPPVWVGSYAWTQLTRPYAGTTSTPMDQLSVYGYHTDPGVVDGYVVEVCEGEPMGRIQERKRVLVSTTTVKSAWVKIWHIEQTDEQTGIPAQAQPLRLDPPKLMTPSGSSHL